MAIIGGIPHFQTYPNGMMMNGNIAFPVLSPSLLLWFFRRLLPKKVASLLHLPSFSRLLGNWEETKFHQSHQILMSRVKSQKPLFLGVSYIGVSGNCYFIGKTMINSIVAQVSQGASRHPRQKPPRRRWWLAFDSSGYTKKKYENTKKNLECCDVLVLINIHPIITFHMEKWSAIPWVQRQKKDHRTLEHGLFAHLLNRKDPQVQHLHIPHIPQS